MDFTVNVIGFAIFTAILRSIALNFKTFIIQSIVYTHWMIFCTLVSNTTIIGVAVGNWVTHSHGN